jgi:integrase
LGLGNIKRQVIEGKWFEIDEAKQHNFDEMMEKFMREHAPQREPTTQQRYVVSLKHLNPYFTGMILADITPQAISDYYQKRKEEGAAVATINREYDVLSKAFNLAVKRWGWCRENPCQKVQKEPEHNQIDRWLTPDEAEGLLRKCSGYLNGDMVDIAISSLHTGMRQGEILSLKWTEIDIFRRTIIVIKTKNHKPRTIPMNETIYQMLLRRSKVRSMTGYVFTTSNGTRHRARNLIREFEKAKEKAGIENFRFHDLRHTAATWMIQSGIDIYTVSKILGHKDIKTTMRYAHHCPDSLRHGVRAIDNFVNNFPKNEVANEAVSG